MSIKSILAGLTKSTQSEPIQPTSLANIFKKNALSTGLTADFTNGNRAMRSVTSHFLEARNAKASVQTKANQTYLPKALIIPLKEGRKNVTHAELSRALVRVTLERNGITPSNIEMEEMMALPRNQRIDMNGTFDKNWKHHDLPGSMPPPGKFKDVTGREAFGYGLTLSPQWQAEVVSDYQQVRGELSKPENIGKKAVVEMQMTERLNEMVKIAWEKGYISNEVKTQLGSLTPEELITAFGVGGAIGMIAATEAGGAALGPAGIVVAGAYSAQKMTEFTGIAKDCAKAVNRQELDKPAQKFGAFLGALSKDGVLAAAGALGGGASKALPKITPKIEAGMTKAYGVMKTTGSEANEALKTAVSGVLPKEPQLATAGGGRIETTNIKPTNGKSTLEKLNDPLEISISSEKANQPHIDIGRSAPYGGARAQEIIVKRETVFVRVHGDENAMSKVQGRWLLRAKDIEGLTSKQIRDKFALPEIPTHITEVYVPANIKLTVGKVALQKNWGKGSGIQYELKNNIPDEAFRNTRPLRGKK